MIIVIRLWIIHIRNETIGGSYIIDPEHSCNIEIPVITFRDTVQRKYDAIVILQVCLLNKHNAIIV